VRASTTESIRHDLQRICRTTDDPIALHRAVVDRLHTAVAFDRWCGLVLDPATLLVTGGYHDEGLPSNRMPRLRWGWSPPSPARSVAPCAGRW
jgi:hypothetical protein